MRTKGQLISKADWRAIDSPKKQTDEFILFAFLLFTANKSNLSVHFLGESKASQFAYRFYLTFSDLKRPTLFENESIIDINYPDLLDPDSG